MYVSLRLDRLPPRDLLSGWPELALDEDPTPTLRGELTARTSLLRLEDALWSTGVALRPLPAVPAAGLRAPEAVRGGLWRALLAFAMRRFNGPYERSVSDAKGRVFDAIDGGRVLEIGPGTGSNLPYLAGRIDEWIGVEPSGAMHRHAAETLERLELTGEVRPGVAEALPVPDQSIDAVVSTLVLCSVDDVQRSLAEVRRVLRPGGKLIFVEHVVDVPGSKRRRRQERWARAWTRFADGCRPNRDALAAIEAAGFGSVWADSFLIGNGLLAPHIAGVATA